MTGRHSLPAKDRRRAISLAVIILVQSLCAAFFASDIIADLRRGFHGDIHLKIEAIATVALIFGVVFMMIELRGVMTRLEQMDRGLRAARGEMSQIIETFFDEWDLTPSEKDVALLILKGFDNEAIAGFRGTAAGTIRAQSARIYAKARVDGRAQLFSVLLEELLAEDTPPNPSEDAS
ncbi:helix-turn-helix transcriptional regulator [Roseovarius sp. S1116L3]|uniref:helix-turn-helix transcriptional regulator n=1 Tax=Roseovarius roseus TaxID=3342636 RepID=UPI0037289FAD